MTTTTRKFDCPVCGSVFVIGKNFKKTQCPNCGITVFPQMPRCQICQQAFADTDSLNTHLYCDHREKRRPNAMDTLRRRNELLAAPAIRVPMYERA